MDKIEQLSYEFGGAKQAQRNIIGTLIGIEKDFANTISDGMKLHLTKGLSLRYTENHPELNQHYVKQGEQYIPVDNAGFKSFKGEKVTLSVNFIMAESSAKFGRLKVDNPALHSLIKEPRAKVQRYISDTIKDMQNLAKKIIAEQSGVETKPRAPNKTFGEKVAQHFSDMRDQMISAKSKGDDTADEARFRKAVVAFNTVWNHG